MVVTALLWRSATFDVAQNLGSCGKSCSIITKVFFNTMICASSRTSTAKPAQHTKTLQMLTVEDKIISFQS